MIDNIKNKLHSKEYDFLKTDKNLGKNIILLGLGGSYAYGVNKTDGSSDIDIRGVALNSKEDILLGNDFEQVVEMGTDTSIYSFNKILVLSMRSFFDSNIIICNKNFIAGVI